MRQIGTALVGIGKVTDTHAMALQKAPSSRFVAVCSRDSAKVGAFAAKYGVKGYTDLATMLRDPEVEAVAICTPQHTHAEISVACSRAGKHVIVEKPMCLTLQEADDMIAAAQQAGRKLGVVCQRRFYESTRRMYDAIQAGKIGKPILCTVEVLNWRDAAYYQMDYWRGKWSTEGGGVMLTQTVHQLDLFHWFMGPIDELYGYWGNLSHPTIEVEDTAIAVARFRNGGLGTIVVSNCQKPGLWGRVHVYGDNGAGVGIQPEGGAAFISGVTAAVDPPINDVWTVPGEEHLLAQWQAEDRRRASEINVMTYYHQLQMEEFLQAIIEDREPLVNGQEGRRHVEIYVAIYRATRDHRPVKFPVDATLGSEQFDGRLPA